METEMVSGTVVVAVSNHSSSVSAVMWALSNKLVTENGSIKLLHVRPPVRTIPTPMGNYVPVGQVNAEIVAAYKRDVQSKTEQFLEVHKRVCDMFKVKAEFVIVESDSVIKALLEQCSRLSITKLILGTSSRNTLLRRLKVPGIPQYIAKHAPEFCSVLVVAKDKLISVREATCVSPPLHSSLIDNPSETRSLSGLDRISHEDASSNFGSSTASTPYGSSTCSSSSSSLEQGEIRGFLSQPLPIQREQAAYAINQGHSHSKSGPAEGPHKLVGLGSFPSPFWAPKPPFLSQLPSSYIVCETNERNNLSDLKFDSIRIQTPSPSSSTGTDNCSLLEGNGFETGHICTVASLNIASELSRISNVSENESGTRIKIGDGTALKTSMIAGDFPLVLTEELSKVVIEDEEIAAAVQINSLSEALDDSREMVDTISPLMINLQAGLLEDQRATTILTTLDATHEHATTSEMEMLKVQLEEAWHRVRKAEKAATIAQHKAEESDAKAKREAKLREEALLAERLAKTVAEEETRKHSEALAAVEAAEQKAEEESRRRREAEERAHQEATVRQETMTALLQAQRKYRPYYREYSYEELSAATNGFSQDFQLGEGGYGIVYKGKLHHTTVAIKVLKQGSVQGLKEFQQEVEVLGRIHHPHMVLLMGACPENGCLVYEYLANGSLEDRLFCRDNTPPLPWYTRFQIVAEVAIALLFLHSSKPEPFVHRDLKPANILLDHNFVSKISDVGLAKLIPDIISYSITEYRETIPVGTFAYIDPEYQRTGVFCPRSDVYALGIVMLQLLTGLPPVGVTDKVENALDNDLLEELLDPSAGDWPPREAEEIALLALQCSELRRRDRPDLKNDVLPTLERIKVVAEEHAAWIVCNKPYMKESSQVVPSFFLCPIFQEVMEDPHIAADGFTYEYGAIKLWLQDHNTSPMTNLKLSHKHLTPNHSLRSAILEWRALTQG